MTNSQFFNELKTLLTSLESLQQYPQFQKLCDAALETGELTLGDAHTAIEWAAYYSEQQPDLTEVDDYLFHSDLAASRGDCTGLSKSKLYTISGRPGEWRYYYRGDGQDTFCQPKARQPQEKVTVTLSQKLVKRKVSEIHSPGIDLNKLEGFNE